MLACSFCSDVLAPSWWSTLLPFGVAAAFAVGMAALVLLAARGEGRRRRIGGLCIAVAMLVALPLAALMAGYSDTHVDVVGKRPPSDAPAWSVRCVTAFQQTEITAGNNTDFIAACSDATRPRRMASYALVLLATALTATGAALAVAVPLGQPLQEVA